MALSNFLTSAALLVPADGARVLGIISFIIKSCRRPPISSTRARLERQLGKLSHKGQGGVRHALADILLVKISMPVLNSLSALLEASSSFSGYIVRVYNVSGVGTQLDLI
jgi:hypothetical protein